LLFLPEETTFWCLVALIEHIMPSFYYSGSLKGGRDDQAILRRMVKRWLPRVDAVLKKFDFDLSLVTFSWFMTLYVDDIPLQTTLRIWDNMLMKGSVVLFQFALGFLRRAEDKILSAKTRLQLFSIMLSIGSQVNSIEDLDDLTRKAICDSFVTWDYVICKRTQKRKVEGNEKSDSDSDGMDLTPPPKAAKKRLNFGEQLHGHWWEPLCSSAEVRDLFLATTSLCKSMAGERGLTYMRVKRELIKKFSPKVIERNQSVLQSILRSHEARIESLSANLSSTERIEDASFNFDDVVLYPALSSLNKLDDLSTKFDILEKQAQLCMQNKGKTSDVLPPSPTQLPPVLQQIPTEQLSMEISSNLPTRVSEQMIRNRTAELCLDQIASNLRLHYMTIKRRLTAEFGDKIFSKYKASIQSVFRLHAARNEGLQAKEESHPRTGELIDRMHFERGVANLKSDVTATVYNLGTLWCGLSSGNVEVFVLGKSATFSIAQRASDHGGVSCMELVSSDIWVGFERGHIAILKCSGESFECSGSVHVPNDSTDVTVTHLINENCHVWCSFGNGILCQYDATSQELQRKIVLTVPPGHFTFSANSQDTNMQVIFEIAKEQSILDLLNGRKSVPERRFVPASMLLNGDSLWIGTGKHLIVQQLATSTVSTSNSTHDRVESRFGLRHGRLTEEADDRVVIMCESSLCLVTARRNEVWSCSQYEPYMTVWESGRGTPLKEAEVSVPWGARGILNLISKAGCVWGVCRDGAVSVWNAASRDYILNVIDSAVPISHIDSASDKNIVVGLGASPSGTVVRWNA